MAERESSLDEDFELDVEELEGVAGGAAATEEGPVGCDIACAPNTSCPAAGRMIEIAVPAGTAPPKE